MKPFVAGLFAAGLLAVEAGADPGRVRPVEHRVGPEVLVPAPGEAAVAVAASGWEVVASGSPATEASGPPGSGAALPPHPVLYVAGAAPSELTRRIVTGRVSVVLVRDEREGDHPEAPGAGRQAEAWAGQVAVDHGVSDEGVVEGAEPWRLFRAEPPARALEVVEELRADPRVAAAEVVVARQVQRRALPDDPLLPSQWHLKNLLPAVDGGEPADLDVDAVWGRFDVASSGWRGRGVRLGIIDDGIEYAHPEFGGGRLDAAAGRNWNGAATGNAGAQGPADTHGTAVAGLAAASADNALGGAGVAPAAGVVSLRLTASAHDDSQEAQALGYLANPRTGSNAAAMIHVKNASWGPPDGVFRLAGPGPLARQALTNATRDGRGGRGTVFVWAAGNGGDLGEDANADGYANNPNVIAVGAMDSSGRVPDYSEGGACVAVVAPSSSESGLPVVTTDRAGDSGFNPPAAGTDLPDKAYTAAFGGTSAAAPQVAGVCALMLEANPALGWRDVKEILLRSARRVNPRSREWTANAVGLRFHPQQGAGLVDAAAATALAADSSPLGPQVELRANASQPGSIPDDSEAGIARTFSIGPRRRVEHALVRFTASHPYRGDLKITLTSPGGTTSVLAPSYFAASPSGQANYDQWVFSSLHFWGEGSQGTWTLRVADVLPEETGRFLGAELTLLAAEEMPTPAFTSPNARTVAVGAPLMHVLSASYGPAAFGVVGPMPPGLEFDTATGTLRGRPTRPGTYALSFRGTNATGTSSQAFELKVVGLYEAWAVAQGLAEGSAGPEVDADQDGVTNLLEYAANGRALVPDAPDFGRSSAGEGRAPGVAFKRWPARSEATWCVEYSADCASWTPVAETVRGGPAESLDAPRFSVAESAEADGSVSVVVTDTTEPAPARGWFRLRAALDR